MSNRPIRLTLEREDIVSIIDALDSLFDTYPKTEHYMLEDEARLEEHLHTVLREYDLHKKRAA